MSSAAQTTPAGARSRPQEAIAARQREATTKVAAVQKAIKALGRTGAPITRAAVAQLAGVSRSFTYENAEARALITAAQARTHANTTTRVDALTDQQQASWRERALNAEAEVRRLGHEITTQRRLVGDLMGRLREPDGTWIENDRERLREDNERLFTERNQLVRERNDLQRRLDGSRAKIAHLNQRRVAELFPDGPGPKAAQAHAQPRP